MHKWMFERRHYQFRPTIETKALEEKERIQNLIVTLMRILPCWLKFFPEFVFYVELEDMLSHMSIDW